VRLLKGTDILFKKLGRLTMRIVGKKASVSLVGKRVYVGIKVHKESWQVTIQAEGYGNRSLKKDVTRRSNILKNSVYFNWQYREAACGYHRGWSQKRRIAF